MATQIFLNLPVKDLKKSMAFFTALGYSFNPQFSNEDGACMVISEHIYAMLLTEPFFQTFTNKTIADAHKTAGAIICLSAESRAEVDEMVRKALAAGGTKHNEVQDHGWMYGHGFQDLDGHLWEIAHMDLEVLKKMEAENAVA